MNKRKSIPYIALLIAFLFWLYITPEDEVIIQPEHHPSYIADDVLSNHYDLVGFNDYRVFADKMTSYPDSDVTLFESPKVLVYIKDKNTDAVTIWQLTSKKGALNEKNKLSLSEKVLIKNLTEDQLVQTMATEQATVMLDSKEITSQLQVLWTGPQMQQQGVGMWASMITEEMTLNSNIEAVYLNETK
ncbi:LPS export ABC transporter periplasmic protein LptC [Psychromonas sp. RZ22]|uniref:LPS export ABC transporter periplasmic protein LptC n=1 Tax=Psychromonas algarum TaxID=2555643 RepID=UPI001067FA85|nr:LPS export ABC transporter periplasmic protein LptC [Psychromonas sp. RZ22]TEW56656.1 LPS export ABC transporter periplasmic protein LptC [Psychromonas sp. RZ22]